MKGINKIILSILLIALIAAPITGCMGGPIPGNLPPIADFTYSPSAPTTADSIAFTDNSTDDDGNIVSWAWGFGDGDTSAGQNPSHSFGSPGNYTVTLTVTDDDGASDTQTVTITVLIGHVEVKKETIIAILVGEIIKPASSYERISAFMLSEPLQPGDVVTSESGQSYPIGKEPRLHDTFFIFIDDEPLAFFAHDTRYVFIDAQTGAYDVINETWPPEINNISMWDTQRLGRGHLIELYSVLDSAVPIAGSTSTAPKGDYGDAPDGQDAYYGVPGRYPTLFSTTNSQFGRPGVHTLNIGEETLGVNVSAEVDANDPADPDGTPNLVDADSDERIFVIVEGTQAKLAFTVTISPNAPDVTRYANALIDFDQSGKWSAGTYGTEWVVVNLEVDVDPGSSETVITPWFSWGNKAMLPSPVWMRLLLTREEVSQSLFANVGGWDGSGQFEYGEVEDYFAFLTDKPSLPDFVRWPPAPKLPPGGDGKPPPGGGGQPPGPTKGPCGYDINYYVIIISGGDCSKDRAKGTPIVKESVDAMAGLAGEQGYQSMGNLGPGNNSFTDIGNAFNQLKGKVKCGDHVLIYICGHGKKTEGGGIALKDASGITQEVMKPTDGAQKDNKDNSLEDFLKKIPPCPDEDCETPGKCCHVTVIIESCYAGNFNVPGVTGEGRTVVGTSTNTKSYATYPGGGVYTQGFDKDSRDPASDTNQDGKVDPMEADKTARDAVDKNNSKQGKGQAPWSSSQECECKCPCKPGIDGEKWVWSDVSQDWVDEIHTSPGQPVTFRLEIENDGECRDIVEPKMIDFLPGCLDYEGDATIFYNGQHKSRPPDEITQGEMGLQLTWNLDEIEALAPGGSIAIEYDAVAVYPGANVNMLLCSAHCAVDYGVVVSDQDTATVMVFPPQEVLYAYVKVGYKCMCDQMGKCIGCTLTIDFEGRDLTGGDYPVTNVVLVVNGVVWHNSGPISTVLYQKSVSQSVGCDSFFDVFVEVTNSIGLKAKATKQFTTPMPCPPVL